MQTTQTGSPKVKKVTSTQPKKRGRPVGSKKKKNCGICEKPFGNFDSIGRYCGVDCHSDCYPDLGSLSHFYPSSLSDELPDSEATVEQVNKYKAQGYKEGVEATDRLKGDMFLMFVVILLGTVVAMILSTPTIISMFDACTQ